MQRQYKKPPIKEAVCEFRFQSGDSWDMAVPGLIYAELMNDFPRRLPNAVEGAGIRITSRPGGQPEISYEVDEQFKQNITQLQGLRFWREASEDGLILVAPNKLAVTQFPPYPSWDEYLPIIQQAFDAYCSIAHPKSIERIGLRYINDVAFDVPTVELEDYFEYYPYLGSDLPKDFSALQMRVMIPFNAERDSLRLQISTLPGEKVVVRLDLDYSLIEPEGVSLDRVPEWLQEAHDNLEKVFEGCLKDSVRAMFD